MSGEYGADKDHYAGLQAAGAVATILILFVLARVSLPLRLLGGVGYSMIAVGAFGGRSTGGDRDA